MSQEKTTLEIIAPTVEEAVEKGLDQLNLVKEAVDVEVLDQGSRGLFGLGSRQARVRLTIKLPYDKDEGRLIDQDSLILPPKVKDEDFLEEDELEPEELEDYESGPVSDDEVLNVSREVVSDLLDKMKVRARVNATYRTPEDSEDEPVVLVNVEGNDLSILIGRRSETLNALQYISSLIICKRLDRWIPIMIDVQGYRARRERQLRQLARRMADQALQSGRRQVLEPMPANERRLIHLELRDNPEIATESVGDEPNRKVTIYLKNQS